jgi:hypothetical protein
VLAEKLGMTVAQLEDEMSVEEFIEWSIFLEIQNEEYQKQRREAMNGSKSNRKGNIRR